MRRNFGNWQSTSKLSRGQYQDLWCKSRQTFSQQALFSEGEFGSRRSYICMYGKFTKKMWNRKTYEQFKERAILLGVKNI